ncbi:serine hydrolase domain-containing protein [Pedobacter nutrimenti]|jgi:CubicO group peptidase (beta-lactamase class C family)|uniref:CubicO group peptidase (Beta-lactamase class C family) n=1 Tax=Pedobacter nutrimenti TaxID=1241337 RepID=A0A318UBQ9_9SPHI|nr:serine hydrolase domain-containing protein [Pedobacter nutrimenti]PYF72995.1 CubicO group peptidase (beta-lactamase class C family) [Pedobacter nutrimenti]
MRSNLLTLLLLFSFTCIFAQDTIRFQKQVDQTAAILQLPGFSIAVVKNGKIVYRQMGGYSDLEKKIPVKEDDLFMIASVTKTMTANLVMQYEQEHKASLDDYMLHYRYIDIGFGWPYNVDVNTRLRHFLSQTSEDGPGNSFVYNGSRFNYMYGLFETAGNHTPEVDAYQLELQKRVLSPLGLDHTIFGFPKDRTDTLFRHIAKPYVYDQVSKRFMENTVNYKRWTRAFPSGGLLSTIGDLVKYTNSYDKHTLLSQDSYQKMTSATVLNDGSLSPYGLGWFSETFAGKKLHWHYGQADDYAALFIRVPETGYTFIFLANSNAPSEALRLGAGQIWESPFAAAFLEHFIFNKDAQAKQQLEPEKLIGKALCLRYTEKRTGLYKDEATKIIAQLAKAYPERFRRYDPGLTYLLTDLREPSFYQLTDQLAEAYRVYGHVQPYVLTDLGNYYQSLGKSTKALEYYLKLADAKGFEFWQLSAQAARKAGQILLGQGKTQEGRTYYWKAINDMKLQYARDNSILEVIKEMNAL